MKTDDIVHDHCHIHREAEFGLKKKDVSEMLVRKSVGRKARTL